MGEQTVRDDHCWCIMGLWFFNSWHPKLVGRALRREYDTVSLEIIPEIRDAED